MPPKCERGHAIASCHVHQESSIGTGLGTTGATRISVATRCSNDRYDKEQLCLEPVMLRPLRDQPGGCSPGFDRSMSLERWWCGGTYASKGMV